MYKWLTVGVVAAILLCGIVTAGPLPCPGMYQIVPIIHGYTYVQGSRTNGVTVKVKLVGTEQEWQYTSFQHETYGKGYYCFYMIPHPATYEIQGKWLGYKSPVYTEYISTAPTWFDIYCTQEVGD